MEKDQTKKGIVTALVTYVIWGLLPIYWNFLDVFRADIVFSHRIIWSFVFILLYIMLTGQRGDFIREAKAIINNKKAFFAILGASLVIGLNWLVFIWAVQNGHVIQSSLGYYINPLMSVVLGVVILKERLSKVQQLSVLLAAIGVLYLTMTYNVFPWISLILATTFAIYGLLKKIAQLNATFSLMMETAVLAPFALLYLWSQFGLNLGFHEDLTANILLLFTGIATAVPLLLFGVAVLYIPLSLVGIIQYLSPTLMLIIGVVLYKEAFTIHHLITFICIWISVTLFVLSGLKQDKIRASTPEKLEKVDN